MKNRSTPIINHFVALVKTKPFDSSIEEVERIAKSIISDLDLNVVKEVSHSFDPQGKTLVYILSESHLAMHTWPEYKTLHVDLVSCKTLKKEDFEKAVKEPFQEYGIKDLSIKTLKY